MKEALLEEELHNYGKKISEDPRKMYGKGRDSVVVKSPLIYFTRMTS